MHLSQRDLERRLKEMRPASNAGFLVSPCLVERSPEGFVVFDGAKRASRRFSRADDTARYLMIHSGLK